MPRPTGRPSPNNSAGTFRRRGALYEKLGGWLMYRRPMGKYYPEALAALGLNFLSGELDSRITFTRASGGTRVNSTGLIETLTTDQPRFDYDPVTLAPRGLLFEESRANLEQNTTAATKGNAGDTLTTDATLAPDGAAATKFLADGSNSQHLFRRANPATTAAVYSVSSYFKAGSTSLVQLSVAAAHAANGYVNFELSTQAMVVGAGVIPSSNYCTSVGGGWYRCGFSITDAGTAGALCVVSLISSTSDAFQPSIASSAYIYQWGAQFELGAFPTSYIPTTTAAVTRAADVASMTGTNFSSWFNATEGTLVARGDSVARLASTYPNLVSASTAVDSNNRISLYFNANVGVAGEIRTGGSGVSLQSISYTDAAAVTGVTAYKANATNSAAAGVSGTQDTSCALPTVTGLSLCSTQVGGSANLNGHLQRITFYNKRLPDATLKALSA